MENKAEVEKIRFTRERTTSFPVSLIFPLPGGREEDGKIRDPGDEAGY